MRLKSDCGEKRIKKLDSIFEKAMKKDGADISLISKYTGLTIDEIRNLRPDGKKL